MTTLVPTNDLNLTADEYKPMLAVIEEGRPAMLAAVAQHGKSHTQFQYSMLDNSGPIAGPTKLRNMRQILAVIDRTEAALEEAYHSQRQKECESRQLRESENELDQLKAEELESQVRRGQSSVTGAIRKLAAYYEQYQSLEQQIKDELGKDEITEADFERDEERFHVMKAFEQALCAARATAGRVDHGNFIYFHDIGINGTCAQADINIYFQEEVKRVEGIKSIHDMHAFETIFLEDMAEKYAGCSVDYAKRKGLTGVMSPVATLGYEEVPDVAASPV